MSSQVNSSRYIQPSYSEIKAESFFRAHRFHSEGLFRHDIVRADNLITSYIKQVTRAETYDVPEFVKGLTGKVEAIVRETSYGTLECPTITPNHPCSCDPQAIQKKRTAEGFLAKPVAMIDDTSIFAIAA